MDPDFKKMYLKLEQRLPARFGQALGSLPMHPFRLLERYDLWRSERSGPPFRPSHRKIIIDITTACDLGCTDCNRSCGRHQAPARQYMEAAQIRKFISESIKAHRKWEEICIEGGEPTLHPNLEEILDMLIVYRESHSPKTFIRVLTNGLGERSTQAQSALPAKGIYVYNSAKTSVFQHQHWPFNLAPCDEKYPERYDFSSGCHLPACYGVGLNRHGYYTHPICGGIDRVLGLDIARKKLPHPNDQMRDQFAALCRMCGFFRFMTARNRNGGGPMRKNARQPGGISESWQVAYERYAAAAPFLTKY